MKSGSNLEKVLTAGHFAVTAELGPPAGSDVEFVHAKAELLRGAVDAVNVTDNQTAVVRMSSAAACAILVQMGIEPVMQMVCRDRNRIAMQSDIFGAAALGIRNLTCLTGDHQAFGNQSGAKKVYDVDSVQLVSIVKRMRDERRILGSDEEITGTVPMFIGAAANPFAKPYEFRALRLAKKVEAGADYVQTQCVYDVAMFAEWMKAVRELGVHTRCRILAGVTPLKSAGHGPLHGRECSGHRHSRIDPQADERRPQGQRRGHGPGHLRGDHREAPRHRGGGGHPHHGHRMGAEGAGDRADGRAPSASPGLVIPSP